MLSRPSSSVSSPESGSSGAGQPAARSSPSAASSASRSATATSWCTRDGDSPAAAASLRIEIPSARAETSAHVRSRSARSSRHAARQTRASTRCSCRPASIRSPIVTRPTLPAVFRKLDAGAVLMARLLPAPQVVRRVLLRRNIAIDAETAQLVADAVQAALRAGAPARPPRRRVPPAGCAPLF